MKQKALPTNSLAAGPNMAGDQLLPSSFLPGTSTAPHKPPDVKQSDTVILISNSVRPAHLNRMEFCILASGEKYRILRSPVRPTRLHTWTTVLLNHVRFVCSKLSYELILRPPSEMNIRVT